MRLELRPPLVRLVLFGIVALLTLGNATGIFFDRVLGRESVYGLVGMFSVNGEQNVPAYYSGITLFAAGVLLAVIACAHQRRGDRWLGWLGLAVIFGGLSFDELFIYHERLNQPVRDWLGTSGVFYYAWFLVYGAIGAVLAVGYLRFLISLPSVPRRRFLTACALFLLGAVGFEMLGSIEADAGRNERFYYDILTSLEELFEMIGVALFIYALLDYMIEVFGSLDISVTNGGPTPAPTEVGTHKATRRS